MQIIIEHVINGVFEWYRYSSQNADIFLSNGFIFVFAPLLPGRPVAFLFNKILYEKLAYFNISFYVWYLKWIKMKNDSFFCFKIYIIFIIHQLNQTWKMERKKVMLTMTTQQQQSL